MAVIFSRAMLDELRGMLDGVRSVGQAQAAVAATLQMAERARDDISQWIFESSWRTQAKEDLANKEAILQTQARQIVSSNLTADVGALWSSQLRGTCLDLWLYAELVRGQFPADDSTAWERYTAAMSSAFDDFKYGLSQAPGLIVGAVSGVAETAGNTVKGLLDGLLGPLKWYLLGAAGLLAVAGVVAYRKGLL